MCLDIFFLLILKLTILALIPLMCNYASNFEKVEGAYSFGLVRPSVRPFVRQLQKSSYSFEIL